MTTPVILLFAYSKFSQILLNLFVGKGDVMCGIHSPVDKKKKSQFYYLFHYFLKHPEQSFDLLLYPNLFPTLLLET